MLAPTWDLTDGVVFGPCASLLKITNRGFSSVSRIALRRSQARLLISSQNENGTEGHHHHYYFIRGVQWSVTVSTT
jgi:hypothetical protein